MAGECIRLLQKAALQEKMQFVMSMLNLPTLI